MNLSVASQMDVDVVLTGVRLVFSGSFEIP
jgi:hypothetical protein